MVLASIRPLCKLRDFFNEGPQRLNTMTEDSRRTHALLAVSDGVEIDGWRAALTALHGSPMRNDRVPRRRVEVGPDIRTLHLPLEHRLAGHDPLDGNATAMEPHRDLRLANRLASQGGEFLGELSLPTGDFDHALDGGLEPLVHGGTGSHMRAESNTGSVIDVNTRSVFRHGQTACMPRNGETSAFWERLTLARESCSPPKGMKQKDLMKDYSVSQAAVTKWKTGKGKPKYSKIEEMALKANVNVNWLSAGQGEMRPLPAANPVVQQLVEVVNGLGNSEAQLEVLGFALGRRALQHSPEGIARLAEAERAIKAQQIEEQRTARNRRIRSGSR